MCDCYENPMVCGDITFPLARKVHHCCECLRDIQPGEYYERTSGIWQDSGGGTYKTCGDCMKLRDTLNIDCYAFGYLMDYVDLRDGQLAAEFFERREASYQRIQEAKKEVA